MTSKKVFFTHTPYAGYFKYKDQFLVYPASIEVEEYVNHKPAVIEFYTEKAKPEFFDDPKLPKNIKYPVPESAAQAQLNHQTYVDLLRLLSLLTNYSHFSYGSYQAWFTPIDLEKPGSFSPAKWGQESVPTIDEENLDPESEYDEIERKESINYYGDNLFERISTKVIYPDLMEQLLEKYFDLSEQEKNVLNTSIILFTQGLDLATSKPSLSIVAFISAIENLITYDYRDEPEDTCKCGDIRYGVTRKFKDYVREFIRAESKTKLNRYVDDIYNFRSTIVHAGGLHIGDLHNKIWEAPREENRFIVDEIEQIARISLVKWLSKREVEKQAS